MLVNRSHSGAANPDDTIILNLSLFHDEAFPTGATASWAQAQRHGAVDQVSWADFSKDSLEKTG